jgi:hypothetical protein
VDLSELAECLRSTKRAFLAVLICCDMTRTNGAQSGARALAGSGVPHVLAMQGDIKAQFARLYLENFLSSLLVNGSVPLAASRGRIASARDGSAMLQALLPTVFRSDSGPADLLGKTIARYRTEIGKLALRVSRPTRYFARPDLERSLREALETPGLVRIAGGLGSGRSTLMAEMIHDRLRSGEQPATRPIFYLTCDTPEYSTENFEGVTDRVRRLLGKHTILLAEDDVLEDAGPEEFSALLDRKNLILVLDNLLVGRDQYASAQWHLFLQAAGEMKTSLLVVADSGGNQKMWEGVRKIAVEPFSKLETKSFVRQFIPDHSGNWKRIYADTGGVPLLLDGLRAEAEIGTLSGLAGAHRRGSSRQVADRHVKKIIRILLPTEAQTLCNFYWLPRPTTKAVVHRFLDCTKNGRGLESLKQAGVLRMATIEGVAQFDIPGSVIEALGRICTARVKRAAGMLIERFERDLPNAGNAVSRYMKSMAERAGGLALLRCMQRVYVAKRKFVRAAAIPLAAGEAGLASDSRWELFEAVLPQMRDARDFPFLLSAAELAHAIGKQNEAEQVLDWIPARTLTPYYRAKHIKLRAAMLKDTKQHAALPEIRALYEEGIPLCEQGLSGAIADRDASKSDWKNLLCDLLQNRLNALAFLEGRSLGTLGADLKRLKALEGDSPAFAYSLCLVAECELKADEQSINWSDVAEKLLEAKSLLRKSRDDRILSQSEYLYGEYLRRKAGPEPEEAAKAYHRSEEAAERSGEPRRFGRARRRWVDLEWRTLSRLKAENACELLEEVIPRLESEPHDSLSMRVLERVYTLRAEIGASLPQDPTERFLHRACVAGAKSMLRAESDRKRLASAIIRYLDAMKATGNFARAQEFIYEFRHVLKETLGVEPVLNDLWAVREALLIKVREVEKERKMGVSKGSGSVSSGQSSRAGAAFSGSSAEGRSSGRTVEPAAVKRPKSTRQKKRIVSGRKA